MLRTLLLCLSLLVAGAASAAEGGARSEAKPSEAQSAAPHGDKQMQGMSILGNDDAPKSLVIVPWKSSELGDPLAVSRALDDGRQPVDRDVFVRELDYYEIRAVSSQPEGTGAK